MKEPILLKKKLKFRKKKNNKNGDFSYRMKKNSPTITMTKKDLNEGEERAATFPDKSILTVRKGKS